MREICTTCDGEGEIHDATGEDSDHYRFLREDTLRDCPTCKGRGYIGELTKEEAEAMVQPYIFKIQQYQAVSYAAVCEILGPDGLAQLKADKIRNLGPTEETVYPWNVVSMLLIRSQCDGPN